MSAAVARNLHVWAVLKALAPDHRGTSAPAVANTYIHVDGDPPSIGNLRRVGGVSHRSINIVQRSLSASDEAVSGIALTPPANGTGWSSRSPHHDAYFAQAEPGQRRTKAPMGVMAGGAGGWEA